jgi:serine-type D-Ala-D-Ala carboxypeptidase
MEWKGTINNLEHAIYSKTVPGIAIAIRHGSKEVLTSVHGYSSIVPSKNKATKNTIWDVASLTKILCTAPTIMFLVEQGHLSLADTLQKFFPQAPKDITIQSLLSHTSGYPAWKPFYEDYDPHDLGWKEGQHRQHILLKALKSVPERNAFESYQYSDIGYIVLGGLIERITALPLDQAWKEILPDTCTRGLMWGTPNQDTVAATEDCPYRGSVIRGETHDLNAASMGGVAGHAGLFGRIGDISRAAHWPMDILRERSTALSPTLVNTFWTPPRNGRNHTLGGWDTPSGDTPSASVHWPSDGKGHLGFTGCSIWIAPKWDLSVTILSNRIHPKATGGVMGGFNDPKYVAFRGLRRDIHSYIAERWRDMKPWERENR